MIIKCKDALLDPGLITVRFTEELYMVTISIVGMQVRQLIYGNCREFTLIGTEYCSVNVGVITFEWEHLNVLDML